MRDRGYRNGITFTLLEYWNSLASSASFADKALEKCLDVIHDDIITVWSLDDPHRVSVLMRYLLDYILNSTYSI
jgi:hypothetical protein